jgi:hypothetical protein
MSNIHTEVKSKLEEPCVLKVIYSLMNSEDSKEFRERLGLTRTSFLRMMNQESEWKGSTLIEVQRFLQEKFDLDLSIEELNSKAMIQQINA